MIFFLKKKNNVINEIKIVFCLKKERRLKRVAAWECGPGHLRSLFTKFLLFCPYVSSIIISSK